MVPGCVCPASFTFPLLPSFLWGRLRQSMGSWWGCESPWVACSRPHADVRDPRGMIRTPDTQDESRSGHVPQTGCSRVRPHGRAAGGRRKVILVGRLGGAQQSWPLPCAMAQPWQETGRESPVDNSLRGEAEMEGTARWAVGWPNTWRGRMQTGGGRSRKRDERKPRTPLHSPPPARPHAAGPQSQAFHPALIPGLPTAVFLTPQ